jgi:GrpB-like predicted nucleotidyltransferase (UPF0157 family)
MRLAEQTQQLTFAASGRSAKNRKAAHWMVSKPRRRSTVAHDGQVVETHPVTLVDVQEIAAVARRVIARFQRDFGDQLAQAQVHHIGATALPFGQTKGDVDINVRVDEAQFPVTVTALGDRLTVAQPENWSETFASFYAEDYDLPLGVQVTIIGSKDDFLLALRDRMRADPSLLCRYNEIKVAAASEGAETYWKAKDELLRNILAD